MNARDFARRRAIIQKRYKYRQQRNRAMNSLLRRAEAELVQVSGRVVGYRLPTGQVVCTKERYRTDTDAHNAMERIQAANFNGHRVPQRAYACEHCKGWHLTSQRPKHSQ